MLIPPTIVPSGCLKYQVQADAVTLEKPPIRFLAFHGSRPMTLGDLGKLVHYI